MLGLIRTWCTAYNGRFNSVLQLSENASYIHNTNNLKLNMYYYIFLWVLLKTDALDNLQY